MDQAKLGKETQAALREKEDEAKHWKKLYVKATGGGGGDEGEGEGEESGGGGNPESGEGDGDGDGGGDGAGALGVDEVVKLQAQVRPWCAGGCARSLAGWLAGVVAARGRGVGAVGVAVGRR